MEQTIYCQPNVESIMKRLRGQQTPYTSPTVQPLSSIPQSSAEAEELKRIVKALGTKLKEAYQTLSERQEAYQSLEQTNKTLSSTAQQLKAELSSKEGELSSTRNEVERAKLNAEQLEKELIDQRAMAIPPSPSPELAILREELLDLRSEQLAWQEEKKRLETGLEEERARGRSEATSTNSHLVRLAMTTKMLEEEAHSLKCERAATIRQFNQIKDLNEETKKALDEEKEKLKQREEALAAGTKTIQELIDTIEGQKTNLETLMEEKEVFIEKEAALSSQMALLNTALTYEKATTEALSTSLKAANDSFHTLSHQCEHDRVLIHELEEKGALLLKEKETAEARVKDVEELLIAKLESISDLEEELGEAVTRCEDLEQKLQASEQRGLSLGDDLEKATSTRNELHEKVLDLQQKLEQANAEKCELKKKAELLERIKKSVSEAAVHAHELLRALECGPKPCSESLLSDEISSPSTGGSERSLFGEHFEQHELF